MFKVHSIPPIKYFKILHFPTKQMLTLKDLKLLMQNTGSIYKESHSYTVLYLLFSFLTVHFSIVTNLNKA